MKKYNLKLFQNNGDGYNFKKVRRKNENIISVGVVVELKDNNICISYNENEIKKCGFDKIHKVEIYKESSLVCYENKVQNFSVEFPYFSSEGIYEIKTTIKNSRSNFQTCIVNTFEFFDYKRKVSCCDFNTNINKIGKDLVVNFTKKFGDLDLSEISLSNINLFDSKNNQIKNLACKIFTRIGSMDFVILDVFDNNNLNKLIPNEIYILKISFKGREIFSSFCFEYDNIEIEAHRVVENINYEILSKLSNKAIFLKLNIKISSLINIDDYDYYISNIRSRFLYFKSSKNEKDDTVVFECLFKNEKNYFELIICKGDNVNVVKFNYDFRDFENLIISQVNYFDVPEIRRNLNKYIISLGVLDSENNLDKIPHLGISDKFGQLSIGERGLIEKGIFTKGEDENLKILFKNVSILNKFSEVYTVEIDYEKKESFIFSPSIGVKFLQVKYDLEILDNKNLKIEFLTKKNLQGKYNYGRNKEYQLEILDDISTISFKEFDVYRFVYLKIYDECNRVYFKTISLYNVETEPFVKMSNGEKYLLDSQNHLAIVDKNIFDYFNEDFEVYVIYENGDLIGKTRILKFDSKFKIDFSSFEITEKGMYYLRFQKENLHKVYSFFVLNTYVHRKIFLRNFDENGMEISLYNFRKQLKEILNLEIFMLIGENKYSVLKESVDISSRNIKIEFLKNTIFENTEYILEFNSSKGMKREIYLSYLGERKELDEIFENINELDEILDFSCENYTDIIRNAYRIFLDLDVDFNDEEFVLWKKLINNGKIDLKYFIKLFIIEHKLSFKLDENEIKRDEILSKILKFLNIDLSSKESFLLNINSESYDNFIDGILNNVCKTQEYVDADYAFSKMYIKN